MTAKKILLIGRGTIAVNGLMLLANRQRVPNVILCDAHDDGVDTWTLSLYKAARSLGFVDGVNVFRQKKINDPEFIETLQKRFHDIDIILSLQPRALFKMPFIRLARMGVVNLHFAPLPKLRGTSTCSWGILDGLTHMGVTFHLIQDEGIDNGPIISQTLFPIKHTDTAWSLFHACIQHGTNMLEKKIGKILLWKIPLVLQNETDATYHPMHELDFSQSQVDLRQPVERVDRFIRAMIFPPVQLPWFFYQEEKIYIAGIKKIQKSSIKKRGYVQYANGVYVLATSDGTVVIDKYHRED